MWLEGFSNFILPTVSTVVLVLVTVNVVKYLIGEINIHIRYRKKHNWQLIKKTSRAHFCNICESLLLAVNGFYCDSCGICADHYCIKDANKKFKCKEISLPLDKPMKHHWIKGNLPMVAVCDNCKEECNLDPGLLDWWCCWCQRCAHETCKVLVDKVCDFGAFKFAIIPPTSIEVSSKRNPKKQIQSITKPPITNWNPLIVIANQKSGNNEGREILSSFRGLLNSAQVIDLSEDDPLSALEWCRLLGDVPYNILVAGGDGSIAWILDTIHKLNLDPIPAVAVLPLGTGNDLSRVLGWGKEYDSNVDVSSTMMSLQCARKVNLDRWSVRINNVRGFRFRSQQRSINMYNYLSIGVDAQIALNFHRTRESRFYLFSHRIFNKLLYLGFGTHQMIEKEYKNLNQRIEVFLDDVKVELPPVESVVVLNIPSWGAGVDLWHLNVEDEERLGEQSFSDKKVEVVAVHSSFQMAQMQVGCSKPYRLGQASTVKIKLKNSCAMQIDGEPWHQSPCTFVITHVNQALMLMNVD